MNRQHLKSVCKKVLQLRTAKLSLSTGRSIAKVEELERNTQKPCNSWTEICQTVYTLESFPQVEGALSAKIFVVEQQKNQISEMHFYKVALLSTFQCWQTGFKTEVCSCSDYLSETTHSITEVVMVDSMDELKSTRSIEGKDFPNFEMLDAKIASSLKKIIQNFRLQENSQSCRADSSTG